MLEQVLPDMKKLAVIEWTPQVDAGDGGAEGVPETASFDRD